MVNAEGTNFVFNMDIGKTLGFIGDKHVKYFDLVHGGDPTTMMVRLSGGANSTVHPAMPVFNNHSLSYPIRGDPDTVPVVYYITSPKGWVDYGVLKQWLSEPRANGDKTGHHTRTLFV